MPKKKEYTPPLIAVIYARYSDRGQNDESIEQQVAECQIYAKTNNLTVIEVYADRAITGRTDRRPDFQKMMRHAEKQQFDVVIAYKSNRMGRDMLSTLSNEEKLFKLGIRTVYAKEEFGDNAAGKFALRSMMNVSQFYSDNLSEDVRRGMRHNALNCRANNGTLPYGYIKGDDGKYKLDPPKAAIAKEIFNRVAGGEAFIDIANDLNSRGIKTSKNKDWGRSSFRLLTNERYTGVYIYDDIRIEGGVPQIIEKELFLRVQEKLNSRQVKSRNRTNGNYILTGKLFCGECGSAMVGYGGTSKTGKQHHYYSCKKRVQKHCGKSYVRREWMEHEIATALQNMLMDDDVLHKITDCVLEYAKHYKERSEIGILEDQLAETKKALRNIMNAIEKGIINETTQERMLELEQEKKRIENCLLVENAEMLNVSREDLLFWFSSFRRGDVTDKEYQEKLFDNILIAAYVYDDHVKLEFNYTGNKHRKKVSFAFVDNVDADDTSVRICSPEGDQILLTRTPYHQVTGSGLCILQFLIQAYTFLFQSDRACNCPAVQAAYSSHL